MLMISEAEIQRDFALTMDRVRALHSPVTIRCDTSEAVVMLPLSDYNSLVETAYLLSSPTNVTALQEAKEQMSAGEMKSISLDDLACL